MFVIGDADRNRLASSGDVSSSSDSSGVDDPLRWPVCKDSVGMFEKRSLFVLIVLAVLPALIVFVAQQSLEC